MKKVRCYQIYFGLLHLFYKMFYLIWCKATKSFCNNKFFHPIVNASNCQITFGISCEQSLNQLSKMGSKQAKGVKCSQEHYKTKFKYTTVPRSGSLTLKSCALSNQSDFWTFVHILNMPKSSKFGPWWRHHHFCSRLQFWAELCFGESFLEENEL